MAVKCENGHWYDGKMYQTCPHCKRASEQLSLTLDDVLEDDKTVSIADMDLSLGEQLANSHSKSVFGENIDETKDMGAEGDKTISFGFFGMGDERPVTGWLVCIKGEDRGKDYRLHSGKNFVGRSSVMDVILMNDRTISREKHCSVIYDPIGKTFFLAPEAGNISYLNGVIIEDATELVSGDEIQLGETTLVFVPFCQEGRTWGEE